MGKAALCVLLAVACLALPPAQSRTVRAQAAPSCGDTANPSPMPGHYTGPWHSDADYHFTANFPAGYNTPATVKDVELKVSIDGTLDVTVGSDGQVTGTATGQVVAPVFHDGAQDQYSNGKGSIKGTITGSLAAAGATLTLTHPVIDMFWGTFGGVPPLEEPVTMPDYTFAVASDDCISGQGAIAENGFPDMNLVSDGTGQLAHAPGIGTASGTWQLSSDAAPAFHTLSQQVDAFIAQANAALQAPHLTPDVVNRSVAQPLAQLEAAIGQNPSVARCLLARLHAWESSAAGQLLSRAQQLPSDLPSLRQAGDLVRSARLLARDCSFPDDPASLAAREGDALRQAVAGGQWSQAALLLREALLLQGEGGRLTLQQQVNQALHAVVTSHAGQRQLLQIARAAYAFGDRAEATAALQRGRINTGHKTLGAALTAGGRRVAVSIPSGSPPAFSWQAVPGADRYVVTVTTSGVLWSWAGAATSVTYGDTALAGTEGTAGDGWPIPLPAGTYSWSVLALDPSGRILGARLHLPGRLSPASPRR